MNLPAKKLPEFRYKPGRFDGEIKRYQAWHSKVAATTPAVSVRNLVPPKLTGVKLFCKASSISAGEKSPSGPMRMTEELNG